MTFDEAVQEAWEQGWYVYSLSFEPASEGFARQQWRCILRALDGPPRRLISQGQHDSPELAVCDALAASFDLEPETTAYAAPTAPPIDLAALIRKHRPIEPLKRRV